MPALPLWCLVKHLASFPNLAAHEFISDARRDIVKMAKSAGFVQVDKENVVELLSSHMEERLNKDVRELDKECHEEEDPMEEDESP
jgi:DNA primase large subunit